MNAALSPEATQMMAWLEAEERKLRAPVLLGSFIEFVQEFWPIVEPGIPFSNNWHIEVICSHLEAVFHGSIKNLLINVPPGTSKSTLCSVMFPAWCWAHDPGLRFFGASYAEPLSIRDSMLCRDIITSPEFIAYFPNTAIRSDANQKTNYSLVGGGWRLATSVGGRGTGMHPHFKIIDDPHNVKQSESDVERQAALNWFDGTMSSRGVILNAATIVIMQRLHSRDLTGHIMLSAGYKEDWEHIIVPMRYEEGRVIPKTCIEWKDPRKKQGELLWPKLFTEKKVAAQEGILGDYRAAGQLQQRPSPAGGGILQVSKFKLWPAKDTMPDIVHVLQSYDTAFTEATQNDPTACTVWGVFFKGETRCVILLDAWDKHMKYPELRKRVLDDWGAEYAGSKDARGMPDKLHPSRRADVVLIEEKGSGISVIQELQRANVPVKAYNPGRASKVARAQVASAVLDADVVYLIESRKEPGKPVTWARPLVTQCEEFPNGEHDDYVDTLTQAFIYMNHADFIDMPQVDEEPIEELDYVTYKRSNPYAA